MTTFKQLIEAVQDNNRVNEGEWKDWDNAQHIQDVYGQLEDDYKAVAEAFLNAAIRDNGTNLHVYIAVFDCLTYGLEFA